MEYREETIGDCRLILGDCREVLPTGRSARRVLATGTVTVV